MAIPAILQQLGQGQTAPQQQLRQAFEAFRAMRDPNSALAMLARQNPQYMQVQQLIAQSGGDARAAFYKLAQERGIDPAQVLSAFR